MDIFNMDKRQKEYINLALDEVLVKKRMLATHMNAPLVGYGGYGGMKHRRVSLEEDMKAWERWRVSLEEA
jgi:hypothetical protein